MSASSLPPTPCAPASTRWPGNGGWDSYWYGDYLAACPFPGVRIRIVDFPARAQDGWRYESDLRITKECTTPMAEIDRAYREVLAQLPAHDIREIEPFD